SNIEKRKFVSVKSYMIRKCTEYSLQYNFLSERDGQQEMNPKNRKIEQKRPTKKLKKTDSIKQPNQARNDDSLPSSPHRQQPSQGISDDDFREILSSMSGWYDRHGYINMLKVLYRDVVTEPNKLYAATKVIELFELVCSSGHLSPADPTVLYDTINVTKPFGLEPEIRKLTEKTPFDIRTVIISKFALKRLNLIKVLESLTDSDVKKISKLYCCEQETDRWELFVDLQHRGRICEENMDDFMRNITTHLIIESKSDPLGLRGTCKCNKNFATQAAPSTADDQRELMLTGDTDTRVTLSGDTGAGPSTSTGRYCLAVPPEISIIVIIEIGKLAPLYWASPPFTNGVLLDPCILISLLDS
ncbi:uncharacterized protein LOC117109027, partial [Anneissia japonica]|uniref:uncharacterized protein LOC117109027 n=1 Tax=Anneissia japonica TaxID=1529436 RepID=UPI001425584B